MSAWRARHEWSGLKADTIDVFAQELMEFEREDEYRSYLSADEVARADRYIVPEATRQFVIARGTLRLLLGAALGVEPGALEFTYGPHGKPSLAGAQGQAIEFNLSHSRDLCLCAITTDVTLGVDVEWLRAAAATEGIARRYFATGEVERLFALPQAQHLEAFFSCWTRKEAYLKAVGAGLTFPLREFDVSFEPGRPAALLDHRRDPAEVERWQVVDLTDPERWPEYAAALFYEGAPREIRRWC